MMQNNSNGTPTSSPEIMLPELTEEDRHLAESHDGKLWALDIMAPAKHGSFGWIKNMGLALQNVGENTLRCICVYDDEPAFLNLAMVNASIEAVGGNLEIGSFTILKEWIPDDIDNEVPNDETPPQVGMEVA